MKPIAILSAPGSRGDVNPMIAIGQSLVARGFDVSISLAEPYRELATGAGMTANVVVDSQQFAKLLDDPLVWKPIRGARRIFAWAANDFAPNHLRWIEQNYRASETVLVSHPLDFASRIFRETRDVPLVDVHLAPSMLRTYDAPPRMTPFWFELSRPAWLVRAAYRMLDAVMIDPVVGKSLQRLRAAGTPPLRRVLDRWWLSPDQILAMYPPWFAPATVSFCPQLVHCGFPLSDGPGEAMSDDQSAAQRPAVVPPSIVRTSDRPIMFTAGTVHHHAKDYFQMATEICRRMNRSGVLLSTHGQNIPRDLPPEVRWSAYEPLGELLRGAAAIVHHGGIGTTAAALSAGCPQIIRPLAFDQFDNVARIQKLGCGLQNRRLSNLGRDLKHVLGDSKIMTSCTHVADRLAAMPSATEWATDQICEWMRTTANV